MQIKTTYLSSFIAWLVILTPSYIDSIIAGMVRKGYTVSATSSNGEVSIPENNSSSATLCLKISLVSESVKPTDIHKDLIDILDDIKAYYHSVIVTPYVDCIWSGSNIVLTKAKTDILPEVKSKKSNLN